MKTTAVIFGCWPTGTVLKKVKKDKKRNVFWATFPDKQRFFLYSKELKK